MKIRITAVDHAPDELYEQTPFTAVLLRELPGPDRPDYWLAALPRPIRWIRNGNETKVTHVVLAARWVGTRIGRGLLDLPVKIFYVVDDSAVDDQTLDQRKCEYVAIGTASEGIIRASFLRARELASALLAAIRAALRF